MGIITVEMPEKRIQRGGVDLGIKREGRERDQEEHRGKIARRDIYERIVCVRLAKVKIKSIQ
jgi:hypothetical protein